MDIFGIGRIVSDIFVGWQEGRTRKREINAAIETKKLEGIQSANAEEFLADSKRQDSLANSWKDEYITIVVSIPLIMCFVPGLTDIVFNGFTALDATPQWYQYMVVAVFSVGAGVPLASKTVKTIKGIMG